MHCKPMLQCTSTLKFQAQPDIDVSSRGVGEIPLAVEVVSVTGIEQVLGGGAQVQGFVLGQCPLPLKAEVC